MKRPSCSAPGRHARARLPSGRDSRILGSSSRLALAVCRASMRSPRPGAPAAGRGPRSPPAPWCRSRPRCQFLAVRLAQDLLDQLLAPDTLPSARRRRSSRKSASRHCFRPLVEGAETRCRPRSSCSARARPGSSRGCGPSAPACACARSRSSWPGSRASSSPASRRTTSTSRSSSDRSSSPLASVSLAAAFASPVRRSP